MESNSEHEEIVGNDSEEIITEVDDEEATVDEELDIVEPPVEEVDDEEEESPALVINVQSWATPIVGLLMLVVGLVGGYLLYPQVSARLMGEAPVAVASVAAAPTAAAPPEVSASGSEPAAAPPAPSDADRQEMMAFLVDQTRHFRGDPGAPVTIIEFSDFQ